MILEKLRLINSLLESGTVKCLDYWESMEQEKQQHLKCFVVNSNQLQEKLIFVEWIYSLKQVW